MSRVGKLLVNVPAGVDVSLQENHISVKGAGGSLQMTINGLVKVANDAGKLSFLAVNESREADAMTGTMRQLMSRLSR